jgi:uncharacterized protein YxeA
MKRVFTVILVLIVGAIMVSYLNSFQKTSFDESYIDNLEKYKQAQTILLNYKDSIKINLNYTGFDTLRQIDLPSIFIANEYYFTNTVLKENSNLPALRQLHSLWDTELMANNNSVGELRFDNDNTVVFNIKFYDGIFVAPMTFHYIAYDPTHKFIKEKNKYPFEVLKSQSLDNDWTYVIARKFFDD